METSSVITQFRSAVETALRELLETKHLYQTVRIGLEPIRHAIADSHPTVVGTPEQRMDRIAKHREELNKTLSNLIDNEWTLVEKGNSELQIRWSPTLELKSQAVFALPTICRGCSHCNAVHPPHNPGYFGSDQSEPLLEIVLPTTGNGPMIQIWSIAYQCQACSNEPVIFSIRRKGEKLQLVGRSLFDRVSIPNHFPEHLRKFYSETQIARTAGKPLPGSLYLRLLVEHHMRKVAGITQRISGDELADAYSQYLPPQIPRSEVSLKEVYATLSTLIHDGIDDVEVLDSMVQKVERHFRLLELFPIPMPAG